MKGRLIAILVVVCLGVFFLLTPTVFAWVSSGRTYARGWDWYSPANWHGARATMQIKSGTCADYPQHGWIGEVLWAATNDLENYVETGYRRGYWSADYPNTLYAYWEKRLSDGTDKIHRVSQGLTVGDMDEFKVVNVGDTTWEFYINGVPARDDKGMYAATPTWGNTFQYLVAGLETNCTNAKLGTSSDPVDIQTIQKKNGSWSFAPVDDTHYVDGRDVTQWYGDDTAYRNHMSWVGSPGQHLTNYRNE